MPFARAGLAQPAANPANDAIYSTPDIYLYSSQHPQPVFRIHLKYQSDGSGDGTGITLGSTQLRPLSERLTLDDGTLLKRDADYMMDYDLGRVTFLHPDTLFAQPRNVTVRYEENPLFVTAPTSIFGIASTLPLKFGDINFIALGQSQSTTFTRPPLGYEAQSSLIAGVNGNFTFNADRARASRRQTSGRESERARAHCIARRSSRRAGRSSADRRRRISRRSKATAGSPCRSPIPAGICPASPRSATNSAR